MNELSKELKCVIMRSGVELWVESKRAENLQNLLDKITEHKFIRYENNTINTADITGIFDAKTMEERTRRKNGEWFCGKNQWHLRGEKCDCLSSEEKEKYKQQILENEEHFKIYGWRKLKN